ncbi:uncharacterized protein LOC117876543 [Trachemys scripta elegans]|uniref:uncharacterized protein LOC117876543 n=1 Tax=Trachemys scripta elegans TaxID=31138 RepID=UPI001554B14C|nr:uncharacterized protein LOC117876543 [Trachemys scripta elegans]
MAMATFIFRALLARGESKIHRLPCHPGTGHSFPAQAPVGPAHSSEGRSPGETELATPASQANKQAQDLNTNHHPSQQHPGKQGRSASAVPVPAAFISPWNRDKREASPLVGSLSLGSATLCRKLAPIPGCCEERPRSKHHICKVFTISCGILQPVQNSHGTFPSPERQGQTNTLPSTCTNLSELHIWEDAAAFASPPHPGSPFPHCRADSSPLSQTTKVTIKRAGSL